VRQQASLLSSPDIAGQELRSTCRHSCDSNGVVAGHHLCPLNMTLADL